MDTKLGGDLSRKSSPATSPSREFSFMISLHPAGIRDSFAIDLSPADEIFFRGHLLPLHLISNYPISAEDHKPEQEQSNTSTNGEAEGRMKRKSWLAKWRKGSEKAEEVNKKKKSKVMKFELAQVLKKYLRMVTPKKRHCKLSKRSCSFIEESSFKEKQDLEGKRRRGLSAPATMQTSPTNSGNNLDTFGSVPCASNGSMDELQTAIQAAIAHCKSSTAAQKEMLNL